VVWSTLCGIRGPEPPAHLKRVLCHHGVLQAAQPAQLCPVAVRAETSLPVQTFSYVSYFIRTLNAQNLHMKRRKVVSGGRGC